MNKNSKQRFIELKELGVILLLEDIRSVSKWCQDKGIDIQVIGKRKVVHRFMVEMELDKQLIIRLKENFPEKWEELYRCYKQQDQLGYLMLLLEDTSGTTQKNISRQRVVPKSKFAKAFAKYYKDDA